MAKKRIDAAVPESQSLLRVTKQAEGVIPLLAQPSPDLQQNIRELAYRLYEERGREDGRAEEDWIQAESIMFNRKEKLAA
ncbi:MAG: hypothetical protein DMG64_07565 [Acidobacteria bacterium]|nr:MAG: hypothetical protein DMG63_08475 [Acidobacteriota bacterium]PYY03518.1 MAG: hypothetical protein DMG64_07565 [Acidobacteriota bacterium]PYY24743.1 MAG: hypothetical protein DMG62_01210 [Acidobacteriota bacterium]